MCRPADRDRGGIRGQDHVGWADSVKIAENLELQVLTFNRRLDDIIGRLHVLELGRGPDPGEDGIALYGTQLPLLDTTSEIPGDVCYSFGGEVLLDIAHHNLQSACRRHLGDAVAHLTGADNTECLDLHRKSPVEYIDTGNTNSLMIYLSV